MNLVALAHPRDAADRLRALLSAGPRPDLLLVCGAVGAPLAPLLRDLVVPTLLVPDAPPDDPLAFGWPACTPHALAFDNALRLALFGAPKGERALLDACLRFRTTLALAPAEPDAAPVFRHAVERGCAVASLPDFAATGIHLAADNFFHSFEARRVTPGAPKPETISFFW